jgi:hypothetical protein
MVGQGTLAVVNYDPTNAHLREFVAQAVSASEKHDGQDFYTYVPINGPRDIAYVWFPHDSHAELASGDATLSKSVGEGKAVDLAHQANHAVDYGVELLHTIAREGKDDTPPPYLMVYGLRVKKGAEADFKAAAAKFVDANAKSKKPLRYSAHRPGAGTNGAYLVVVAADDLADLDAQGSHNEARVGDAATGQKLADSIEGMFKQPLRYVPAASSPRS